jgi:hypothetical protein
LYDDDSEASVYFVAIRLITGTAYHDIDESQPFGSREGKPASVESGVADGQTSNLR